MLVSDNDDSGSARTLRGGNRDPLESTAQPDWTGPAPFSPSARN